MKKIRRKIINFIFAWVDLSRILMRNQINFIAHPINGDPCTITLNGTTKPMTNLDHYLISNLCYYCFFAGHYCFYHDS